MARFILLRLLHTILILFGVSIVAFSLIHLIPGNPLDILLPPEAPKEVVERLKVEFGFDKPLYLQYLAWLGRVLSGNLGTSVFTGLRATGELLNMTMGSNVFDLQADDITSSELTVGCQIEHRRVSPPPLHLQSGTDRPNMF